MKSIQHPKTKPNPATDQRSCACCDGQMNPVTAMATTQVTPQKPIYSTPCSVCFTRFLSRTRHLRYSRLPFTHHLQSFCRGEPRQKHLESATRTAPTTIKFTVEPLPAASSCSPRRWRTVARTRLNTPRHKNIAPMLRTGYLLTCCVQTSPDFIYNRLPLSSSFFSIVMFMPKPRSSLHSTSNATGMPASSLLLPLTMLS